MDACIVFIPIGNFIICLLDLIDYLAEADARSFFRLDEEEESIDRVLEEELKREIEAYEKWEKVQGRANKKKLQKD